MRATRTYLLGAGVLGAALILVLLYEEAGDESVAPVGVLTGADTAEQGLAADGARDWPDGGERSPLGPAAVAVVPDDGPAAVPLASAEPPAGAVRGQLVDEQGVAVADEPVALFLLRDHWEPPVEQDSPVLVSSATADAEGRFELPARPQATHVLVAGGGHWARVAVEPVVHGDDLLVRMEGGLMLHGVVRAAETGAPVPGASVVAGRDDVLYLDTTDEEGAFAVGPLSEDDQLVGSWAPGYDVTLLVPVSASEPLLTVELEPAVDVRGRVVERDSNTPIEGAQVRLSLQLLAFLAGQAEAAPGMQVVDERMVETAADGSFALEAVPTRGFVVAVQAPGYVPRTIERFKDRPLDPERDEIVLELQRADPVTGWATVALTGAPASGALVVLQSPHDEVSEATAQADGSFMLATEVWDGQGKLHVMATDAEGRSARARVRRRDNELHLQLVDALRLPVQVVAGDSPLVGARVGAISNGSEPTVVTTGAGGEALLVHPLAGPTSGPVVLQARHGLRESLPLTLSLDEVTLRPAGEPFVLDVESGFWLRGEVLDLWNQPVASALVRVRKGPVAHSDRQGRFRLGPLDPDTVHRVDVQADGYRPYQVQVDPGTEEIWVTLQRLVQWAGRATDAATGLPLEKFQVSLQREALVRGELLFEQVGAHTQRLSDGSGEFTVDLEEPGRYRLLARSRDYGPAASDLFAFDGITAPPFTDLVLGPAAVLEVLVLAGDGRPVEGYGVGLVPWDLPAGKAGKALRRALTRRTNRAGLARFDLGEGGGYRVASGRNHWLDEAGLFVTPGPPVQRAYRLPATGDLVVHLVPDADLPGGTARVSLRSSRGEKGHQVVRKQGVVRSRDVPIVFEVLPPGRYDIQVAGRGIRDATQQADVLGHTTQHVDVQLHKGKRKPGGRGGANKPKRKKKR